MTGTTLNPDLMHRMDAYWRAANFLSVGQIYLRDNPLLKRPLVLADVKHMLLGHWGATPGQNFIYAHLNRVIGKYDLDMIYVSGPGHGGPAVVANSYLEGTYSEVYPAISQDEAGLARLFRQFSFPGGIPSHASPECPGSIHEGGELGYSLSHSFGAVFDNPELVVACVVGDGEAETGALFTPGTPVIFALHAYPALIHRLTYQRVNHHNFHVHGYREEGTTTTPFDMTVLNRLDRYHLAMAAIDHIPHIGPAGAQLKRRLEALLVDHRRYINQNGQDLPDIRNWRWDNQPRRE